ncbi:MAG: hypothetical protein V1800_03455, partial [Candidatus Latescibacterota bacterium]
AYPDFLVKQVILSGEMKLARDRVFSLSGDLQGITSNQDLSGAPTTFSIQGTKSKARGFEFALSGAVDYRGKKSTEAVKLEVSQLSLKGLNLGDSPYLPPTFDGGEGSVSLDMRFDADAYSVDLDARMEGIRFVGRAPKGDVQKILDEIYDNLNLITLRGQIKSTAEGMDTRLSSNLDRYLQDQIRTIVKRKVDEAKVRVRKELDRRVDELRGEIEKEIAVRRQELEARIETKSLELERGIETVMAEIKKHQQMVEDRIGTEKGKAEGAVGRETEKAKKALGEKLKKLW